MFLFFLIIVYLFDNTFSAYTLFLFTCTFHHNSPSKFFSSSPLVTFSCTHFSPLPHKVGYGDYGPRTPRDRVATIILVAVGIISVYGTISNAMNQFMESVSKDTWWGGGATFCKSLHWWLSQRSFLLQRSWHNQCVKLLPLLILISSLLFYRSCYLSVACHEFPTPNLLLPYYTRSTNASKRSSEPQILSERSLKTTKTSKTRCCWRSCRLPASSLGCSSSALVSGGRKAIELSARETITPAL